MMYEKVPKVRQLCIRVCGAPGKLRARPVQQPATPALIPGNKTIDHSSFSILLIQRNRK
jgi:hypothetical protein